VGSFPEVRKILDISLNVTDVEEALIKAIEVKEDGQRSIRITREEENKTK